MEMKDGGRQVLFAIPIFVIPLTIPIWIGLTQTATNPGMANFFYYEFFVTTSIRGFSILGSLIVIRRVITNLSPESSKESSTSTPTLPPKSMDTLTTSDVKLSGIEVKAD